MSNVEGAPRAVIIGTGRSGTGYMSRVVTEATGHATCGHEAWFRAIGDPEPGFDVDSSWLALPAMEVGIWFGPAVHVVRHPVATVASLLRTELFGALVGTPYSAFAIEKCKAAADALAVDGPVAAAVEFWANWNARCAAVSQLTVRLEDVSDFEGCGDSVGAATLDLVGDTLGVTFEWHVAAEIPTTVNTRPHPIDGDLTLELDEDYIWERLGDRAGMFGYAR